MKLLVTGGTGFIALHVVYQALQAGWEVVATVRNPDSAKTTWLKRLPRADELLTVVKADLLMDEAEWVRIIDGVDYVAHVASHFAVSGEREDFVGPAVKGTTSVIKACIASATVKRVVVTSSCSAVCFGHKDGIGAKVWGEEDWTEVENLRNEFYNEAKTLAERAAWELVKSQPTGRGLTLATVNPTGVFGATLSQFPGTSVDIIKQVTLREVPGLPHAYINACAVVPVARAHLRALVVPEAAGRRFVLGTKEYYMPGLGELLGAKLREHGYNPTTSVVPSWIIWLGSFCSSMMRTAWSSIGQHWRVNNTPAKEILGLELGEEEVDAAIVETATSAIAAGFIEDKSEGKTLSSTTSFPDYYSVDTEGIRPGDVTRAAGEPAAAAASAAGAL